MRPVSLQELAWVHDCALCSVLYDAHDEADRSVEIVMKCPRDLGFAPWEGRTIAVIATGVALFKHTAREIAGADTVDAIRPGVSSSVHQDMDEAIRSGIRFPSVEASIAFHSGSEIELICKNLQVEIKA